MDSGNVTDPSGNLVATLIPNFGADQGIISASGTFFPDAKFAWKWEADQKFAYLHAKGVGIPSQEATFYIEFETDSDPYISLNSRFLIGEISLDAGQPVILNIFGAQ